MGGAAYMEVCHPRAEIIGIISTESVQKRLEGRM
jgi:hypothetical protein